MPVLTFSGPGSRFFGTVGRLFQGFGQKISFILGVKNGCSLDHLAAGVANHLRTCGLKLAANAQKGRFLDPQKCSFWAILGPPFLDHFWGPI